MSARPILRLGAVKDTERFLDHLQSLRMTIPCDREIAHGGASLLRWPLARGGIKIGNRVTVHPMEG